MAKVHSIWKQVRHRKNILNLGFGGSIDILTEKDGRFMKIGNLTGELRKLVEDRIDCSSLSNRGMATEDQVISKKERVDGWTARPRLMPERFLFCSSVCKRIDSSLIAITKRYGNRGTLDGCHVGSEMC